jgi:hypothetical protein
MNKQVKRKGGVVVGRGIEWISIPEFDGFYATSDGRIGSEWRPTRTGSRRGFPIRELGQRPNLSGYMTVKIMGKAVTVHRLVTRAFLGKRPTGLEVCHNDGNKQNNHISNLRYDTKASNELDKVRHGRSTRGEANNTTKLTSEQVFEIRRAIRLMGLGSEISQADIARYYGVSPSTIHLIATGKIWVDVEFYL